MKKVNLVWRNVKEYEKKTNSYKICLVLDYKNRTTEKDGRKTCKAHTTKRPTD